MYHLLATRFPTAPARVRQVRPWLESLEARNCPGGSSPGLTLNYTVVQQNQMQFTGHYGATGNAGQTIVITGQGWSGQATTDSNGNYSVIIPVTKLGTATAVVQQHPTVTVQTNVTVPPPNITNFQAIDEGNGEWEFKGTVSGTPDPQGLTINFSGFAAVNGLSTTVLSDGTFDVVFDLGNATGFVTASTTDWWGQASNQPEDFI
jgi:hypothetical protein